jgi:hypothetical protein
MAIANLQTELKTYLEHRERLLEQEGKFVVIHGSEVAGVWDTYEDALKDGYQRFGLEPFLVKQIEGTEPVQFFTRDVCRP